MSEFIGKASISHFKMSAASFGGVDLSFHFLRYFARPMRAQLTLLVASQPPPSPHFTALASAHGFALFHTRYGTYITKLWTKNDCIATNPAVLGFVASSFGDCSRKT